MLRHINELGGIAVYTKNLIGKLLEIDKRNEYVFLYNTYSLVGTYSKYKNVKEVVIDIPNKLLWDQIGVPKVVKSDNIDIIFNPKLSIPVFTPSKKIFALPGLEQFALPNVFKWYDHIYFRIMIPLYCHRSNAIIVMTNTGKNDLMKYINVNRNKIEVIYGSCHKRFRFTKQIKNILRIKKKYNLPDKYILFVGGITPLKNFSNIIRAFNIIKNKISIKLIVVGFKRWKYAKDICLINKLDLQNDIITLGFIPDDDLPYLYNSAQCLALPSLYEGFGIPILEAQACGCPVICSKTGCAPEVSGGAALLVDPYNYKEIAQVMYDVLSDIDLRKKLIAAGLENVKNFSWLKAAEQTLQLFKKISQSKSV